MAQSSPDLDPGVGGLLQPLPPPSWKRVLTFRSSVHRGPQGPAPELLTSTPAPGWRLPHVHSAAGPSCRPLDTCTSSRPHVTITEPPTVLHALAAEKQLRARLEEKQTQRVFSPPPRTRGSHHNGPAGKPRNSRPLPQTAVWPVGTVLTPPGASSPQKAVTTQHRTQASAWGSPTVGPLQTHTMCGKNTHVTCDVECAACENCVSRHIWEHG